MINLGGVAAAVGAGVSALSGVRCLDIPRAGEVVGDLLSVPAVFTDAMIDDWRVRLTLPTWPSFRGSPVLAPLADAGGLIFPYTPTISIDSTATYSTVPTIHSNYAFHAFQRSDPGVITITAPMNVEDKSQALYWIAALHFMRSLTKMFSGNDPKAGNPPAIVKLNGYGSYVFKNIPVVVTSFGTQLDAECDYIPVNTTTSFAGQISSVAEGVNDFLDIDFLDTVAAAAQMANSLGFGGSSDGGVAWVPTKSSFTIKLMPAYSRANVRRFSLDNFVAGGYLSNNTGYI
jgi:hypothetical protein